MPSQTRLSRTVAFEAVGGDVLPGLPALRASRLPADLAPSAENVDQLLHERAEGPRAAQLGGPRAEAAGAVGVPVVWPIRPEELVDFYLGNPWLCAVGNLLTDAVSAGKAELRARSYTVDGQELGDRPDAKTDEEYARAMAWLQRETFGLDGLSELDLSGFLGAASSSFDQVGHLFAEVNRTDDGKGPERLVLLLPQFVNYLALDGLVRLEQRDPFGGGDVFHYVPFRSRRAGDADAREYLHERRPNLVSSLYGLPAWIGARESVEVDNAHRKYLKAFMAQHASPRWLVEVSDDPAWDGASPEERMVDDVYNTVRDFLAANRGEAAGRNLVMKYPGGIVVKVTPLDVTIEDPSFEALGKGARDEILAVRHVSLVDLGLPEGGYRATAETQSANFRDQVLVPFSDPAVRMINRVLHAPPPHGLGITRWDLALDFVNVGELLARYEGIAKATGTSILSPDEGRELAGYEPVGLPGIYGQAGLVELSALGDLPEPSDEAPFGEAEGGEDGGLDELYDPEAEEPVEPVEA